MLYKESQKLLTDKVRILQAQLDAIKENTTEATDEKTAPIQFKIDSIRDEYRNWKIGIMASEPNPYGYKLYLELLENAQDNDKLPVSLLSEYFPTFEEKFPDHPYTEKARFLLQSAEYIKEGGQFLDFPLVDASGKQQPFADRIAQNKLTLLDLWAPWCGSCIRKSREIAKQYESLHEKGLEVIAVVGGIETEEAFLKASKRHQYPWPLHKEINEQHKVWETYGIGRSGGSQFLIDQQGVIRAINPKPEKVAEILDQM